jgi:CheY-like chemotaxis protein
MAARESTVKIDGVEIVSRSDMGVMCRVAGRSVWVGAMQMPAGVTPPPVGSGRSLVVYESAARELGLVPAEMRRVAARGARRILIVDDNEDITEPLCLLLGQRGYEVETAATAQWGIARAAAWRPDIVILDLALPDMEGEQAVSALKSDGRRPFVVAYTGFHHREAAARAAGCDAFVMKPGLDVIALAEAALDERERTTS